MSISWIGKQLLILSETAPCFLYPNLTEATGINSVASPQVETSLDVPRVRTKRTPKEDILLKESNALRTQANQETLDKMNSPDSLSPKSQAWRTKQLAIADKQLAEVKRLRHQAQERLRPPVQTPIAQPHRAACVNRSILHQQA